MADGQADEAMGRQRLGWTPRLFIDVTVDGVVDWYKQFAEGADANELTLANIAHFTNKT